jgi:hypothetical protein
MPIKYVIGIDPGAAGGVGRLWSDGTLEPFRMPSKAKGGKGAILPMLRRVLAPEGLEGVVIEHVWGRKGDSARSVTTFMKHVGLLEGYVTSILMPEGASGMLAPLEWVTPTVWQPKLGCPKAPKRTKGGPKAHIRKRIHKTNLKDYAHKLFPKNKLTLYTADAALIALYAGKLFLEKSL